MDDATGVPKTKSASNRRVGYIVAGVLAVGALATIIALAVLYSKKKSDEPASPAEQSSPDETTSVPGCNGAGFVEEVSSCDDPRCEGLAFVPSMNICSGCIQDTNTRITTSNVDTVNPGAILCSDARTDVCPENYEGDVMYYDGSAIPQEWNGLTRRLLYASATSDQCASQGAECDGKSDCIGFIHTEKAVEQHANGACLLVKLGDDDASDTPLKNLVPKGEVLFCRKKGCTEDKLCDDLTCPTGDNSACCKTADGSTSAMYSEGFCDDDTCFGGNTVCCPTSTDANAPTTATATTDLANGQCPNAAPTECPNGGNAGPVACDLDWCGPPGSRASCSSYYYERCPDACSYPSSCERRTDTNTDPCAWNALVSQALEDGDQSFIWNNWIYERYTDPATGSEWYKATEEVDE